MKAALIRHDKVTDELGNTVEIKLWKIPPTPDKPLGYDNSEQKGDHRHYGSREEPYDFSTLRQLADDFLDDVERFKRSVS